MSIYATLWQLKFPRHGDNYTGSEWIEVAAQGVPGHIGTPAPGYGYERGDPYRSFLPPPVVMDPNSDADIMRAVVFVTEETRKGTKRAAQKYVNPLLVLTGAEYERLSFQELHEKICDALRGNRPRQTLEMIRPDGSTRICFEDGSFQDVNPDQRMPPKKNEP